MVMFPFESVSSSRHPPDPVVPCSAFSLLCAIVIGTSVEIEPKLVRAIAAAGADGLLIEVHHDSDKAICDGPQSLYPDQLAWLMNELRIIVPVVGRKL